MFLYKYNLRAGTLCLTAYIWICTTIESLLRDKTLYVNGHADKRYMVQTARKEKRPTSINTRVGQFNKGSRKAWYKKRPGSLCSRAGDGHRYPCTYSRSDYAPGMHTGPLCAWHAYFFGQDMCMRERSSGCGHKKTEAIFEKVYDILSYGCKLNIHRASCYCFV